MAVLVNAAVDRMILAGVTAGGLASVRVHASAGYCRFVHVLHVGELELISWYSACSVYLLTEPISVHVSARSPVVSARL